MIKVLETLKTNNNNCLIKSKIVILELYVAWEFTISWGGLWGVKKKV